MSTRKRALTKERLAYPSLMIGVLVFTVLVAVVSLPIAQPTLLGWLLAGMVLCAYMAGAKGRP